MKKIIHNIYFFFYLSFNWNLPLAFFIIWHEIKRGTKYHINTVKPEDLRKLTIPVGDITKSSPYEAVSYYLLEILLEEFRKISNEPSFIDLGCGKGRAMVVASYFDFTSVTGIDFAKELCEAAEKNMKKVEGKFNRLRWKVICQDVLNYKIQETDNVFFMSNPFDKEILTRVLEKIEVSLKSSYRKVWFLYAFPLHLDALLQYNYKIIQYLRPDKKLNAVIMKKAN